MSSFRYLWLPQRTAIVDRFVSGEVLVDSRRHNAWLSLVAATTSESLADASRAGVALAGRSLDRLIADLAASSGRDANRTAEVKPAGQPACRHDWRPHGEAWRGACGHFYEKGEKGDRLLCPRLQAFDAM